MHKVLVLFFVVFSLLVISATSMASVGVGVGTGKIAIKEPIKSGSIYKLPSVIVFNTGTETATYTMAVTLNQTQPQLKPDPAWFSFSPNEFTLDPHKSQIVTPSFHPPIRAQAGDYFAYLEAHPAQTVKQGKATVGVAAATKLYFKVEPSNIFIAIFNRLIALFQVYAPWSYILSIIVIIVLIITALRRYLHLNIQVTRNKAKDKGKDIDKAKAKDKGKDIDNSSE